MTFEKWFEILTDHKPFPWQVDLYHRFCDGHLPSLCNLPTGLGKTSIIAIWLIALSENPLLPRRLVYVVNRRTVVDQTTEEVERIRRNLSKLGDCPASMKNLAISTLRGQFADNREWSADPARPAVICGTVDMIGSRLLFSGYGIGFKSKPLHAGFLGQDVLLIHDEAHLEPAFQKLIESIDYLQNRHEGSGELPWHKLRVMQLSATTRDDTGQSKQLEDSRPFGLTDAEKNPPEMAPDSPAMPIHYVWRRLQAKKHLRLTALDDEKQVTNKIAEIAVGHRNANAAVVVFVSSLDAVTAIEKKLTATKCKVVLLTGTMRGKERDELVTEPAFRRFIKGAQPGETVYLVCTSAGEVGIDISADHLVCDLSTFDSMAQRFGRVNRYGDRTDTQIDVVHPNSFDDKHPLTSARLATLELLVALKGDASPLAVDRLDSAAKQAAFAPEPTILPATDILFDAWAMTTIRDKMPGRPPIAPYLHGLAEWEPPRTSIAWREEVERIRELLLSRESEDYLKELLADYPLKPHELLNDRTDRVVKHLTEIAKRSDGLSIWLLDKRGAIEQANLTELLKADNKRIKDQLADCTVLLPPSAGGLTAAGMLDGLSTHADDVADRWLHEDGEPRRQRVWDESPPPTYDENAKTKPMALIRTIDTQAFHDEFDTTDEQDDIDTETSESLAEGTASHPSKQQGRYWHWYARPRDTENATRASARPITWDHHIDDVVNKARQIVSDLTLPDELQQAVILAAELHDLGKQRFLWQRSIGNPNPDEPPWYAKPGKPKEGLPWRPRQLSDYRHEFGSLLDVMAPDQPYCQRLKALSPEMQDVVLHLIAAHHGYARPHFSLSATIDPNHAQTASNAAAIEVMRRYARLQRRYGRWGLAYLESLLRAADWAASANPSENGDDA